MEKFMESYPTLTLAIRNLFRNRRRTILTLIIVILGCAAIIFFNAWTKGSHDQMISDGALLNAGHIQVHKKGFWAKQNVSDTMQPPQTLYDFLDKDNEKIMGYGRRIYETGLIAYKENTTGIQILGVEPQKELIVTDLKSKILPGGRFLRQDDTTSAIIGGTLAKNMSLKVGNTFSIIAQGLDGSISAEKLTVVGLFNSGDPEYDQTLILMPFEQAKQTFSMGDDFHSIILRLTSLEHLESTVQSIRKITGTTNYEIMGWDTLMPEIAQFCILDDGGEYIFAFILYIVIAFGVFNTIQMGVFERTREFGVMLSIGTTPGQIVKMILIESFIISSIGIFIGIVLGVIISYIFKIYPIDFSAFSKDISYLKLSVKLLPCNATMLNISVTAVCVLFCSMFFSVFPAWRASKLNPVEAIRQL
jgi:ABC-type lipoprotein release transport system permease subunit